MQTKRPGQKPGPCYLKSHDVLLYVLAEGVQIRGHGDGEADAFAGGEAVEPVEEFNGLGLRVGVEQLVEVVDEYVRDVVVACAQAADEALHKLKGAYLIVAGIDETGLVGYIKREVPILLDADDVALLTSSTSFFVLPEPFRPTITLTMLVTLLFYKVRQPPPTHGTYSLPFFRQECNM